MLVAEIDGLLLVELDFAELQAGAGCHADELEAVVAEVCGGGHLETVLLLVLVAHAAVELLFVEGCPRLFVVRARDTPGDWVAVGIGMCVVTRHKAVL